jgi:hypothetical protein
MLEQLIEEAGSLYDCLGPPCGRRSAKLRPRNDSPTFNYRRAPSSHLQNLFWTTVPLCSVGRDYSEVDFSVGRYKSIAGSPPIGMRLRSRMIQSLALGSRISTKGGGVVDRTVNPDIRWFMRRQRDARRPDKLGVSRRFCFCIDLYLRLSYRVRRLVSRKRRSPGSLTEAPRCSR